MDKFKLWLIMTNVNDLSCPTSSTYDSPSDIICSPAAHQHLKPATCHSCPSDTTIKTRGWRGTQGWLTHLCWPKPAPTCCSFSFQQQEWCEWFCFFLLGWVTDLIRQVQVPTGTPSEQAATQAANVSAHEIRFSQVYWRLISQQNNNTSIEFLETDKDILWNKHSSLYLGILKKTFS